MNPPATLPSFLAPGTGRQDGRDLDWAEHLDWMEGLEPVVAPTPVAAARAKSKWPGLIAAALLTWASFALSTAPAWPFTLAGGMHPLDAALLAMVLGMILGNLRPGWTVLQPGMRYGAKSLLALGIVLLGVRLDFTELLRVGGVGIGVSAACVVAALIFSCLLVSPLLGVGRRLGFLLGAGTAICGGSAIVAVAPAVDATEEEIVLGVASVALVGLCAMFILPVIGAAMHLSQIVYGVWAGLAIHQVPQVITAGFSFGTVAGKFATVIKLARVCLLAPVVLTASVWSARRTGGEVKFSWKTLQKIVPMFVVGFILMAAATSLGILPDIHFTWAPSSPVRSLDGNVSLRELAGAGATFLLALGMAGIGWETRLVSLLRAGIKPLAATFLVSVLLGAVTLAASMYFFR